MNLHILLAPGAVGGAGWSGAGRPGGPGRAARGGPALHSSTLSTHSFSPGSHTDYADPFQTHLEPRGFATNTFKTVSS